MSPLILATLIALHAPSEVPTLKQVPVGACMPDSFAYSYHWWQDGYRKRSATGAKVLCFRGGTYAFGIDVETLRLPRFGRLKSSVPVEVAARQTNELLSDLPEASLELSFRYGGDVYKFAGVRSSYDAAGLKKDGYDHVRLVDAGRFVQRFLIEELVFRSDQGKEFQGKARLEVCAKPKSATFSLEVVPAAEGHMDNATNVVDIHLKGGGVDVRGFDKPALGQVWWGAGQPLTAAATADFGADDAVSGSVRASILNGEELRVRADEKNGWTEIALPGPDFKSLGWGSYYPAEELDRLERYKVRLENPSDHVKQMLLVFSRDHSADGDTGFTPMIRDLAGEPTGIPVQLSKNWHRDVQRVKYDGGWFHGFATFSVPAHSSTSFEYSIVFGRWGAVPAVSHAQLSVLGYLHAPWQDWQQVAIGSWGESICYEPSRAATRSMILDWRPTLVFNKEDEKAWGQYLWTNNVGGGDFLVLNDANGNYVPTAQAKTYYRQHGPNLSDVEFHDVTVDGALEENIRVRTGRTDDVQRTWHSFRYDVRKQVDFTRLAFYQFGADNYLWFDTGKFAVGNESGILQEWKPEVGGNGYRTTATPLTGRVPWISMHESKDIKKPAYSRSWANRGLVVRHWKARLGGKDVPTPYFASFGIDYWIKPVANIELVPPPNLHRLLPGDFVECDLETLILPQSADDYYGPNSALRHELEEHGDTAQLVMDQASGNDVHVIAKTGVVVTSGPVEVKVDPKTLTADFVVSKGLGWVPVTISGLPKADGFVLYAEKNGQVIAIDQSVAGNDFWQTDYDATSSTYRRTYNVPGLASQHLIFRPGVMPTLPPRVPGTPAMRPIGNVGPKPVLEFGTVIPGAVIRYTLDGSDPTENSQLFSAPVHVDVKGHLTVRARLFLTGHRPGPVIEYHLFDAPDKPLWPGMPSRPPRPDIAIESLKPLKSAVPPQDKTHHFRDKWTVLLRAYGEDLKQGVAVQGGSEMDYAVPPGAQRFVAIVGLDDALFKHEAMTSMVFRVLIDGKLMAESPVLVARPAGRDKFAFDLPIPAGAKVIQLITTDAGDGPEFDFGDWACAGFITGSKGNAGPAQVKK